MTSRVLATLSLPLFNSVEASYARGRSARWSTRGVWWSTQKRTRRRADNRKCSALPDVVGGRDGGGHRCRCGIDGVRCQSRTHAIRGWPGPSADGLASVTGMAKPCLSRIRGGPVCVQCQSRTHAIRGWPGPPTDNPPHTKSPAVHCKERILDSIILDRKSVV